MPKESAGVIMYRMIKGYPEVLLIHPGGPFWMNKDYGVWSIPKGELAHNEDYLSAAIREFREETGSLVSGDFMPLNQVKLKSGKVIFPFAVEGNIDEDKIVSNTFLLEWPPRSGDLKEFPEVDKAGWFDFTLARQKINAAQKPILEELERWLLE